MILIEKPLPEEVQVYNVDKEEKISLNYVGSRKRWNQNDRVMNNNFAYNVTLDVMWENKYCELQSVQKHCNRDDWKILKVAIQ